MDQGPRLPDPAPQLSPQPAPVSAESDRSRIGDHAAARPQSLRRRSRPTIPGRRHPDESADQADSALRSGRARQILCLAPQPARLGRQSARSDHRLSSSHRFDARSLGASQRHTQDANARQPYRSEPNPTVYRSADHTSRTSSYNSSPQGRFVEAVRSGNGLNLHSSAACSSVADARNATASGFICSDPLSGIAPGQRKGQLCTAWLGCFTCPNAVIPLEPDTLARLSRMRDALADARIKISPDRWQLLYAPKLQIIERDILPRFPSHVHALAQTKIAQIPPPPPIE